MRQVAVIMAGGSGTRLWPLSRRSRPKQLIHMIAGRSLIRESYDRLRAAFKPQDIYIIALAEHRSTLSAELPSLPPENFLGEPVGRDTTNAIALSAAILHQQDADTIMGVFTADHLIRPTEVFVKIVRRGYQAAVDHTDALITFGIKPDQPHTGLGYIEQADEVDKGVWSVKAFREKPDLQTARRYLASGRYAWNSGMFVWRTATILQRLKTHVSVTYDVAMTLAKQWSTERGPALAEKLYPSLPRVSIDYAVMEKMFGDSQERSGHGVLMVEMDLEWLDLGQWTALPAAIGSDSDGNTQSLKRAAMLSSKNNILVTEDDHLIAAIGVEDLVIVHSRDATLVCHRDQVQRIKELVAMLDEQHEGHYS